MTATHSQAHDSGVAVHDRSALIIGDASQLPRVGVLAMQGAFAAHVAMLQRVGADAFEVRTAAELERCDGIVLPGGESTAIRKALDRGGLLEPLRAALADGLPVFGTCAGMIVLADTEPDGAPPCFALLDIDVERNGFGRQVHSAEVPVELTGDTADDATETMRGVFIRAPRITRVGTGATVVGRAAADAAPDGDVPPGEAVVVLQDAMLAASFHPELTDDTTLHRRFLGIVRAR